MGNNDTNRVLECNTYNFYIFNNNHIYFFFTIVLNVEYQKGMHQLTFGLYKIFFQQLYLQLHLDEMHPKINIHFYLGMDFEMVDMLFVHCSFLFRNIQRSSL
uniref:GDSL-lipase 1 n=1 Tax=Solanum tuberosum TaxID=4113 RepID=M1B1I4_SOLTU